jgi:hypothetical protein
MNVIISNSPVIPSGVEAGLASTGTYTPSGVNRWITPTVGGQGGGIYLEHNGTRWILYSSYGPLIAQSDPCNVSVQPWEAVWPSPMVVAAAQNTFGLPAATVALITSRFGTVANFLRLRNQGQI